MKTRWKLLIASTLFGLSQFATAHAVWLEKNADGIQLNFGEYSEGVREQSPGKLDEIGTPKLLVAGQASSISKSTHAWYSSVQIGAAADIRATAEEMPVRDWRKHSIGIVKPMYYARYAAQKAPHHSIDAAELNPLDIIPTGKSGEFQLFLQGKPVAGGKLTVIAPNGWQRELRTNKEGKLQLELPKSGLYVLEATHLIAEAGNYQGQAYTARRLRATLSWQQQEDAKCVCTNKP